MATHSRTAARPLIHADLWIPMLLFPDVCPCQERYLAFNHLLFDEIAEVALAAANGDILGAHEVTEEEWAYAHGDYPILDSGLTTEQICSVFDCDWSTVLWLSVLPSVSRLRALRSLGTVPVHRSDLHPNSECRYFKPMR
jgi:hypothetical protein